MAQSSTTRRPERSSRNAGELAQVVVEPALELAHPAHLRPGVLGPGATDRLDPLLGLVAELAPVAVEELDPVVAPRVVGGGDHRGEVEPEPPDEDRGRRGRQYPGASASPPPPATPAASAASSIGPDSRVSRTISTCGRAASTMPAAAWPSASASSAVSTSPATPPRTPSVHEQAVSEPEAALKFCG